MGELTFPFILLERSTKKWYTIVTTMEMKPKSPYDIESQPRSLGIKFDPEDLKLSAKDLAEKYQKLFEDGTYDTDKWKEYVQQLRAHKKHERELDEQLRRRPTPLSELIPGLDQSKLSSPERIKQIYEKMGAYGDTPVGRRQTDTNFAQWFMTSSVLRAWADETESRRNELKRQLKQTLFMELIELTNSRKFMESPIADLPPTVRERIQLLREEYRQATIELQKLTDEAKAESLKPIEQAVEKAVEKLRAIFKDQIIVDLGHGWDNSGYKFANLVGAKAYIGVDLFMDTRGGGIENLTELYKAMGLTDEYIQKHQLDSNNVPWASVREDGLTFLRALPSDSVSVFMGGLCDGIIPNLLTPHWRKEITRVTDPQGGVMSISSEITPQGMILQENHGHLEENYGQGDYRLFIKRPRTPSKTL